MIGNVFGIFVRVIPNRRMRFTDAWDLMASLVTCLPLTWESGFLLIVGSFEISC